MSNRLRRRLGRSPLARSARAWLLQLFDPGRLLGGLGALPGYWADYRRYRGLAQGDFAGSLELWPALHEKAPRHELDAHYFYVNAWAMRRIVARGPALHFDAASQVGLSALLSAIVPVAYLDYRPLHVRLPGLSPVAGSLLELPCAPRSLTSISCLHVAEHVGLGRYGDPIDPDGTRKAARELARVLMPGGDLYFAVPVGRPRVCFNAHRVHSVEMVLELFPDLVLRELSGVTDDGSFVENVDGTAFAGAEYACGMFWFSRGPA